VPFDTFVSNSRQKLGDQVTVEDEGSTTIGGVPGYVVIYTYKENGTPVRSRNILLDGPDNTVYAINNRALSAEWPQYQDTFDSSLSTFEIGKWPKPPIEPAPHATTKAPVTPTPPVAPPRPVTAAPPAPGSVDQALAALAGSDLAQRSAGLDFLATLTPDARRRPAVVAALLPLLDDGSLRMRRTAAKCLQVWVDGSSEPALLSQFGKESRDGRRELMPVLASLKTQSAATALAQRLGEPEDRAAAVRAMIQMGSVAEPAARNVLTTSTDKLSRPAACDVLKYIGTAASLSDLDALASGPDRTLSGAAKSAAAVIRRRNN
jgi:hypothetical protein